MSGLALYSKNGTMYAFEVAYEYGDTKFVGFRKKETPYDGNCYRISPRVGDLEITLSIGVWYVNRENNTLTQKRGDGKVFATMTNYEEHLNQEDLLKVTGALKNKYAVSMFEPKSRFNIPVGKKYTQLPGGGGGFKVSRGFTNPLPMVKNETIVKILDKFYALNEVRKVIKKEVSLVLENQMKKKKKKHVDFIGAIIEDPSEINKLNKIVDRIDIPEGWKTPKDYHMTITKDSGEDKMMFGDRRRVIGKEVNLKLTAIGVNEGKAIALKESGEMWSRKDTKHITIAYKETPKDSDEIVNWKELSSPIIIKAVIRQVGYDKEIMHDIQLDEPENQLDERGSQITVGNFQGDGAASGAARVFPKMGEYES